MFAAFILLLSPLAGAAYSAGGSRSHLSMSDNSDEVVVPPLRYLGDSGLMSVQPLQDVKEIHSVEFFDKLTMLRTAMKKYGGIGIAAPQIGWWVRVFCFGIDGSNARYAAAGAVPFSIWINPEIDVSGCEGKTNWMWEGCLSVPGMRGWIQRPSECVLRGLDENGQPKEARLAGLAARIAQHEFDHLDGILFPRRAPDADFLVPQASFDVKDTWAEGWPSRGSHATGAGWLSDVA